MGSNDTKSSAGLMGHDLECPTCYAVMDFEDLMTFDSNCPNCFNPIDPETYGELEFNVKSGGQDEDDEFGVDVSDFTDSQHQTLCCSSMEDDCNCPQPWAAPSFEDSLHTWLEALPDNIYKVNHPSPCIKCAFQWSGMCKPLVESLMILHLRDQQYPKGDAPEEEYYLGAIDGCIDYTKLTEEDEYVRQVRVSVRRGKS